MVILYCGKYIDHTLNATRRSMNMRSALLTAVLFLALFALVSCGGGGVGGGGESAPTTQGLLYITVTPASPSAYVGETEQFTATGWYATTTTATTTKDLTNYATWTSSNTTCATIADKGLATGVAAGSSKITAAYGAASGYTYLYVTTPPVTLLSIAVTPSSATVQETATQQFIATGSYSDGSSQNLTTSATWTSSNGSVGFVSNLSGSKGLATGMAAGGPVTITATYSGKTGTASFTVIPKQPDLLAGITSVISNGTTTVTVSYAVRNNGLADAGAFDVDLWPNLSSAPAAASTSATRSSHTGLAAGATLNGTVSISGALAAGTAYAVVDALNTVSEVSEANNVSAGYAWPIAGYACANVANKFGGFCADIAGGFELTAPQGGSLTFGGYGFASYPTNTATRNSCSLALFGNNGTVLLEPTTSSSQSNNGPYQTHWAGDNYYCKTGYGSALISAGMAIDWLSYSTGNYCNDTDTDAGLSTLTCLYPSLPSMAAPASFNFDNGATPSEFTLSGNTGWIPYAADLSFQSGDVLDSQKSCFSVKAAATSGVSFDLRVDSESYDRLKLYIDGALINSWSGIVAWTHVDSPLTNGTHEYKWCYEKDGSISTGADAAWVDNINIY